MFQLASLFDAEAGVNDLTLSVMDRESVQQARTQLQERSHLDPSQADAVVDVLTREVAGKLLYSPIIPSFVYFISLFLAPLEQER